MRKSVIAGLAAGAFIAVGATAPAFAVDADKADLSVLHGVPGLTVDVYVNGALTLDNFTPGTLAGPLPLDPGSYTVAIASETSTDDSAPLLPPVTVTLAAGSSYTAVAHLDAAAAPTVSLFTNDISATAAGEGRLTVRHTAAAPSVDVLANGAVAFPALVNPNEAKADLPVGTYAASLNLAGTATQAFGPADVSVAPGVNTIVYAWGNAGDDTLTVAVQSVTTNQGSPSGVAAGSAPLPGEGDAFPAALVIVASLALAGAGIASRVAVKARG